MVYTPFLCPLSSVLFFFSLFIYIRKKENSWALSSSVVSRFSYIPPSSSVPPPVSYTAPLSFLSSPVFLIPPLSLSLLPVISLLSDTSSLSLLSISLLYCYLRKKGDVSLSLLLVLLLLFLSSYSITNCPTGRIKTTVVLNTIDLFLRSFVSEMLLLSG